MTPSTFIPPHESICENWNLPKITDVVSKDNNGSVLIYMPTITICGSTRFYRHAELIENFLTHMGWIVYAYGAMEDNSARCYYDPETIEHSLHSAEHKRMLDRMWEQKICHSDAIYVINEDGYIGESTAAEIALARLYGKRVFYMVPVNEEEEIDNVVKLSTSRSNLVPLSYRRGSDGQTGILGGD